MRYFLFIGLFLFSVIGFTQEIGSVNKGAHSLKLIKQHNNYSLQYSDIKTSVENSVAFPKIESVYNIILDGFKNENNHLVIVKTTNDTIIKFEFTNIDGEQMMKIRQNNLNEESFGASTYYSKVEIENLFGNP